MRLLSYCGAMIIIMVLTGFLGAACSNPDNITTTGITLAPSPVKVAFTDPQFRVEDCIYSPSAGRYTSDSYRLRTMRSVGLGMLEMKDLMSYISAAQSTIDLCSTRINNHGMVAKLIELSLRGVNIRIVTEDGYFNDPNSKQPIQELMDAGVQFRTDGDDLNRQMHQRYWIIDNHIVLCGSGDLLDMSFTRSTNNTLIFNTPLTVNANSDVSQVQTITDAFFFDFTQMFDRNKFGRNKDTMLKHTFRIGVDVEIYFGPNDSPEVLIRDELLHVDDNIFYAINQITPFNSIWNLIDALVQSGLSVSGVYDGPSALGEPPNGAVYDFPNLNGMNNKFMVIDVPGNFEDLKYFSAATSNDPIVLTGSGNWTTVGLTLNDETLVIVHDMTLAFRYAYGEAYVLSIATLNAGIVFGEIRSAYNNIALETTITIESARASAAFPGTAEPIEVESDPDTDGFYGAAVPTGKLFRLEIAQPPGHLIPPGKFQFAEPFLLLPGASYEANFYPKLQPTGTGTGGT